MPFGIAAINLVCRGIKVKNLFFQSIIVSLMEKTSLNLQFKKDASLLLLISISIFMVLFMYFRITSSETEIFLSNSLRVLATTVLVAFFSLVSLLLWRIIKLFFTPNYQYNDPKKLLYHLQLPFHSQKFKSIFIVSSIVYFIFFGFLSNMFIYFTTENTVFSIFPRSNLNTQVSPVAASNIGENIQTNRSTESSYTLSGKFLDYNIIVCCNDLGYIPMVIFYITSNFSVLVIPINLLIALLLSILVGLSITLNVFVIRQARTLKTSKKNASGLLGIPTGLLAGCPTCAGSLFYSLLGFNSAALFSYLNIYQMGFIATSIPLLLISVILMMKISKTYYLKCNVN